MKNDGQERDAVPAGPSASQRTEAEELMVETLRRYLLGFQVVENLRTLVGEGLEQTRELALTTAEQALRSDPVVAVGAKQTHDIAPVLGRILGWERVLDNIRESPSTWC